MEPYFHERFATCLATRNDVMAVLDRAGGDEAQRLAAVIKLDCYGAAKPGRTYQFGIVTGDYEYHLGTELPHRRLVSWKGSLNRDDMSSALASSAGSVMTEFQLTAHTVELDTLTQLAD